MAIVSAPISTGSNIERTSGTTSVPINVSAPVAVVGKNIERPSTPFTTGAVNVAAPTAPDINWAVISGMFTQLPTIQGQILPQQQQPAQMQTLTLTPFDPNPPAANRCPIGYTFDGKGCAPVQQPPIQGQILPVQQPQMCPAGYHYVAGNPAWCESDMPAPPPSDGAAYPKGTSTGYETTPGGQSIPYGTTVQPCPKGYHYAQVAGSATPVCVPDAAPPAGDAMAQIKKYAVPAAAVAAGLLLFLKMR